MKILKKIGIALLVLILLLVGISFVLPKEYHVEVTKKLDAPKETVFATVSDLNNNAAWNTWAQMDTTMVTKVGAQAIGKGASFSWTSPQNGGGSLTFNDEVPGEKLDFQMEFDKRPPASGSWIFAEADKGTNVTWTLDGSTPRPMNLMNFVGKKFMKTAYNQGLDGLSEHVQNQMDAALQKYPIQNAEYPYSSFVMIKDRVKIQNYGRFYQENLRPLYTYLLKEKHSPAGPPCGLVFSWDEINGMADMAAAIPLEESVQVDSEKIENYNLPYKKAIVADYYGPYEKSVEAHEAISYYCYRNGIETVMPVVEEYVTDQSTFPEQPEKWLTKIYYFVK